MSLPTATLEQLELAAKYERLFGGFGFEIEDGKVVKVLTPKEWVEKKGQYIPADAEVFVNTDVASKEGDYSSKVTAMMEKNGDVTILDIETVKK